MIFPRLFAVGADIAVAPWIEGEVAARKAPSCVRSDLSISFTCGSIPRSSTSHPINLGRAVTRVGDQARQSDFGLFGRAVEHRLGRSDFRLANGGLPGNLGFSCDSPALSEILRV